MSEDDADLADFVYDNGLQTTDRFGDLLIGRDESRPNICLFIVNC